MILPLDRTPQSVPGLHAIRRLGVAIVLLAALLSPPPAGAEKEKPYVYVGPITSHSVLIAWGVLGPAGNTVGRDSVPLGPAKVRIAGREVPADKNWVLVDELAPDTEYAYEVEVAGRKLGDGKVRTDPEKARKLAFFVIGDWGNGSREQYRIAEVMLREFEKRRGTDNPVRFVITTGDNIYGDLMLARRSDTGNEDKEWERKFFRPYAALIRSIPFYPTLGNHDGNVSEDRKDLPVYLDNFFFPGNMPARWYRFSFGGLADFFALDSTWNTLEGPPYPHYIPGSDQFRWMQQALGASSAPWKIAYFHHPPFSAGPRHDALQKELRHWVELFANSGVNAVFNGHEHNFQFTRRDDPETRGVQYVVSGAGGELRPGDVRSRLRAEHIAGWAGVNHFLLVEIEDRNMRITPLGFVPVTVRDADGRILPMPLELKLP